MTRSMDISLLRQGWSRSLRNRLGVVPYICGQAIGMRWRCPQNVLCRSKTLRSPYLWGNALRLRRRRSVSPSRPNAQTADCPYRGQDMPWRQSARFPQKVCYEVPVAFLLLPSPHHILRTCQHLPPQGYAWGGCERRCFPAVETPESCSANGEKEPRKSVGRSRV